MLFPVEQAFVWRDEKRAPLKTPAWEASYSSAQAVPTPYFQYDFLRKNRNSFFINDIYFK